MLIFYNVDHVFFSQGSDLDSDNHDLGMKVLMRVYSMSEESIFRHEYTIKIGQDFLGHSAIKILVQETREYVEFQLQDIQHHVPGTYCIKAITFYSTSMKKKLSES